MEICTLRTLESLQIAEDEIERPGSRLSSNSMIRLRLLELHQ